MMNQTHRVILKCFLQFTYIFLDFTFMLCWIQRHVYLDWWVIVHFMHLYSFCLWNLITILILIVPVCSRVHYFMFSILMYTFLSILSQRYCNMSLPVCMYFRHSNKGTHPNSAFSQLKAHGPLNGSLQLYYCCNVMLYKFIYA